MLLTIAVVGTRDVSQHQTAYVAQARDAGFLYQPGELCGLNRAAGELQIAPSQGRIVVCPCSSDDLATIR